MSSNNFLAEPIGLCQIPPAPRNKGNAEAMVTYGVIVWFARLCGTLGTKRLVFALCQALPVICLLAAVIPSALAQAADPVPPEIRLKSYVRNQTLR